MEHTIEKSFSEYRTVFTIILKTVSTGRSTRHKNRLPSEILTENCVSNLGLSHGRSYYIKTTKWFQLNLCFIVGSKLIYLFFPTEFQAVFGFKITNFSINVVIEMYWIPLKLLTRELFIISKNMVLVLS